MKNKNAFEAIGSAFGTATSATGTALQTSEVLQIISIVITIIGGLITIALGLRAWWKDAKKDGKITKDEIKDGIDIIMGGAKDIKEHLDSSNDSKKGEK